MHRRLRTATALAGTAALALALAGPASAGTLKGTVVHKNRKAQSFTIARADGTLKAIHARRSPRVGRVVKVSARLLRNGTYAARRVQVVGQRKRARIRGTVTHVNRSARTFTVSASGVSLLVRRPRTAGRASAASDLPAPGTIVTVDSRLSGGDAVANKVREEGEDTDGIELEGVVLGIDEAARTLTVSADDEDESGAALTVQVPDTFDLALFSVGQSVSLNVTPQPDGTFALTGSASDEGTAGADDSADEQGDEADDDQESEDGGGNGQQPGGSQTAPTDD